MPSFFFKFRSSSKIHLYEYDQENKDIDFLKEKYPFLSDKEIKDCKEDVNKRYCEELKLNKKEITGEHRDEVNRYIRNTLIYLNATKRLQNQNIKMQKDQDIRIKNANEGIEEISDALYSNLKKTLDNFENLENAQRKAEKLQKNSKAFLKKTNQLNSVVILKLSTWFVFSTLLSLCFCLYIVQYLTLAIEGVS